MTKTIIITGASQGIGKATAETFLKAGWTVGCLARNGDKLAALCDGQEAAIPLAADVADSAAVDAAFAGFVEKTGRIDALFNNAGRGSAAVPIDEIDDETWNSVVGVNVTGMFNCARAAFRQMRAQDPMGGRIVNNGSVSAYAPRWRSLPYTTTKHAVSGMTKSLSLDGRAFDIACGQIDIGNALTDMTEDMASGKPQANGNLMPEPTMDVAHVANTVLNMCEMPLDANVQFVTVMATKMPYIGRGGCRDDFASGGGSSSAWHCPDARVLRHGTHGRCDGKAIGRSDRRGGVGCDSHGCAGSGALAGGLVAGDPVPC